MHELTLGTLTCGTVQSTFTSDDIFVEFTIDGNDNREPFFVEQTFSSVGDTFSIDRKYGFQSQVEIVMRETDLVLDDPIDTVTIDTTASTSGTVTFQGDGAEYDLDYQRASKPNGSELQLAVDDFKNSNKPTAWPNLTTKATLVSRVERLVDPNNPNSALPIDQDGALVCGPAGITFALAHYRPRRFVEVCRSLYEWGAMLSRTGRIEPNGTLRRRRVVRSQLAAGPVKNRGPIDPLDWMLMASFADITSSTSTTKSLSEANVREMTREVIGYEHTASHHPQNNAYLPMLQPVENALNSNGVAFLGVFSQAVAGQTLTPQQRNNPQENHLVTVLDVQLPNREGGRYEFELQNQGQSQHINSSRSGLDIWLFSAMTGVP